jgi:hypothetical protein
LPKRFSFDLYRLNIEDSSDLFIEKNPKRLRSDFDIKKLLELSCDSQHDQTQKTRSAVFKWSIRSYKDLSEATENRDLIHIVLARSILEKDGMSVTDDGLTTSTSISYPPLASTIVCLFDLSRHLVAVEHTGDLSNTSWHDFLHKILASSAQSLKWWSTIELEEVPAQNKIVDLFLSFQRVTRMKITLRIPNPELNRYTKSVYEDLKNSGIREITQDMKSPNGLSQSPEARPFASAVLAEQGYKKGEVTIEGLRNDTFEVAQSGNDAARGVVKGLRDFVRGMNVNLKTKEAKTAIAAICAEIDRIHPLREQ